MEHCVDGCVVPNVKDYNLELPDPADDGTMTDLLETALPMTLFHITELHTHDTVKSRNYTPNDKCYIPEPQI